MSQVCNAWLAELACFCIGIIVDVFLEIVALGIGEVDDPLWIDCRLKYHKKTPRQIP